MICEDTHPYWHDADGEAYTCEWYKIGSRCNEYGHGHSNFGLTANQACCSCGGGTLRELNPVSCEDSPDNWHDSDGSQYDCQWYSNEDRCTKYGHSYSNFGKTAQEACCSCNGGVSNPMSNEVTTSPPTAATTTCEDRVPNWHDADGVAYTVSLISNMHFYINDYVESVYRYPHPNFSVNGIAKEQDLVVKAMGTVIPTLDIPRAKIVAVVVVV